jgi:lipopolysaccharide transport system ATP-binding protein
MSTVIKVENLSKQYRLGLVGVSTFKEDTQRWWARMRGKEDPFLEFSSENIRTQSDNSKFVWSLKDINFEVQQGDILGIIGRNGAGKSTLLKILSKVTAPTTGSIKVKGRIASLLEVGTGFHPELTGRENIYLNGAILGMRKHEITRKLDEIVAFAGVEKYVDTPVKRYSSGMYVRLAFAVAAHLESEILIVDEVLAVGDTEFQLKCLGKMGDISKGDGRTILFVSHNMASITSLCNRGICLKNGTILFNGETENAVRKYLTGDSRSANFKLFLDELNFDYFQLNEIKIQPINLEAENNLNEYHELQIFTRISVKKNAEKMHITYVLKDEKGDPLFTFSNNGIVKLKHGENFLICTFPKGFLNIGDYYLDFYVIIDAKNTYHYESDIMSFTVQQGKRPIGAWMGKEPGFIKPVFDWKNK